jgi:hypothetical protein
MMFFAGELPDTSTWLRSVFVEIQSICEEVSSISSWRRHAGESIQKKRVVPLNSHNVAVNADFDFVLGWNSQ